MEGEVQASYRFRFYPTREQQDLLTRTFGCVRAVYNHALSARASAWTDRREFVGLFDTCRMLTQWKTQPEMAWLRDVSSVPLQQALRHLDAAYRRFFCGLDRHPRFKTKGGRQAAEFINTAFSWSPGRLKLAKMDRPLRVVWSRPMPGPPTTVTIVRESDGRWFLTCRVKVHKVCAADATSAIGIDLGLLHFAAISTGEKIENPRHIQRQQRKLAKTQRAAARKQKGSNNRKKAAIRVARVHARVVDARRDFLHKLSTRLISENQTICLETLSVKGMLRSKRASRSIADAAWGEFTRMVIYKAEWYGRTVIKIGRWFPSTKTCSECGSTGHVLKLSEREWTCPGCGSHLDRDVNAALNILAEGLSVAACGGNVRPKAPRRGRQIPVNQESRSRDLGTIAA